MSETAEQEWLVLKRVALGSQHLQAGRAKHTQIDSSGSHAFPAFTSLEIIRSGPGCYYLMHICQNGSGTDTWHQSLEDAEHQAEYEFEVKSEEWTVVCEEKA